MISLYDKLPKYLLDKHQQTSIVVFTAGFGILFILLFMPFLDNPWFKIDTESTTVYLLGFFILCFGLIALSRKIMYNLREKINFTILKYVVWCALEMFILSAIYVSLTAVGGVLDLIEMSDRSHLKMLLSTFLFSIACMGVPYVISYLYLSLADKSNTIRLMNYSNVVSDTPAKPYEDKKITLFDNNGVLKFSIDSENLYYIESDDNYIKAWYTDSSHEIKQYMLRCKLNTIEESFAGSDLVRCHRKYIVNVSKIKILKAERDGYMLELDLDSPELIPVSKSYEQNLLAKYNSK